MTLLDLLAAGVSQLAFMPIVPLRMHKSGSAGHRYWRLNISANGGAGSTLVEELEFREVAGGADVTGTGTAIGSHASPGNAFDNNTGTAYNPAAASGVTIGWDFGAGNGKNIVEVAITTSAATTLAALPKDFTLEYSDDGAAWTDSGNGAMHYYGPLFSHTHAFPEAAPAAGFHRFWRIFCETNNGGSSFIVLDDVELHATAGSADQTAVLTGANGGATGRSDGSTATQHYKCFDSNISGADPYFMSGTTNTWVGYIFPSAVKVEEVLLQCYTSITRAPNIVRIEYSDDGVTWTQQKRITGLTWTSNERKTLAAI